jgi:hypothetical protein
MVGEAQEEITQPPLSKPRCQSGGVRLALHPFDEVGETRAGVLAVCEGRRLGQAVDEGRLGHVEGARSGI